MDIQLNLSVEGGQVLKFNPGLPAGYRGPLLQGATCCSTHTDLAHITLQKLVGEGYSACLFLGNFLKRVTTTGWIRGESLYSVNMLKNSCRERLKDQHKMHIRERQYSSFYTPPTAFTTSIEAQNEFRMLVLFYSPQLLEELTPFFPELKSIVGSDSPQIITKKPFWISTALKGIIHEIFNCPFNESNRPFYFDLKLKEILHHILESSFSRKAGELKFTPWEVSKIHEARNILMDHIAKKPPSIRQLSKMVALNEYKLKTGFHQYFDNSIAQWMHEQKMQYSKELILNTNRPIKEICTLVGYPLTTNFITTFKKHFGITPGDLRRR